MRVHVAFLTLLASVVLVPRSVSAQPTTPLSSLPSGTPSGVRAQIERLYSEDAAVRREAALALEEMGTEAAPAIPFLVALLHDGTRVAVPDEFGYFSTFSDPGSAAASALVKMEKPAVKPLLAALTDGDATARENAVYALSWIGDLRGLKPVMAALEDASPEVRQQAAVGLAHFWDLRAVPALVAAAGDRDRKVRTAVISALNDLQDMRAVPALIAALEDNDQFIRQHAAHGLGQLWDPRAIDPLIDALGDTS